MSNIERFWPIARVEKPGKCFRCRTDLEIDRPAGYDTLLKKRLCVSCYARGVEEDAEELNPGALREDLAPRKKELGPTQAQFDACIARTLQIEAELPQYGKMWKEEWKREIIRLEQSLDDLRKDTVQFMQVALDFGNSISKLRADVYALYSHLGIPSTGESLPEEIKTQPEADQPPLVSSSGEVFELSLD